MADKMTSALATLVDEGRQLLDASEPTKGHYAFRKWDGRVAQWLNRQYPDSGLSAQWSALPNSRLVVGRHYYNDPNSWETFQRTVTKRLAWLGNLAQSHKTTPDTAQNTGSDWECLLHPAIHASALAQYRDGHWRDAVLNAFIAVFDLVRHRTGLDLDGERLATRVFSAENPILIVADLGTESGKNDQTGFMMVMQGVFRGIRNPKAHSLQHDLNALKSAQYLVMASLLARRVDESKLKTDDGPV